MTYKQFAEDSAPSWGAEFWERLHSVLGLFFDGLAEGSERGMAARYITGAPADALDYVARERGLERGRTETTASFRQRLREAFEAYQYAGTEKAIEDQLGAVGYSNVEVYDASEWDSTSTDWWRFWVVIDEPHGLADSSGEVGSLTVGSFTVGGIDENAIDLIRRIIRKWKAAHTRCESAIVALNTSLIGTGWVVGDPVIGGSAAYISV